MFPRSILHVLISAALLLSGCSFQVSSVSVATDAPPVITATLPPTGTPRPTETPLPLPSQPTVAPVEGTASTQINVRAEPSTASEVLGVIAANAKVEIVGMDPGGNWWQILYPTDNEGKGWVTAQYVETASQPEVPVIGGDESNPIAGNRAVAIQQLNIRSGPATNFNSLGILNTNDVVRLTGRNSNGSWLQIEFAEGSNGKGWVNAAFIQAEGVDGLPIVSDVGEVIGTGTPMDTPLPPTPRVVPASMDNDSADNPIKTVILEDAGTQTVLYNGDVSSPDGDTEDWVAVTPNNDVIFIGIQCSGSASIQIEIARATTNILCNEDIKAIPVDENTGFLLHIIAVSSSSQLQYVNYTLTIKASP